MPVQIPSVASGVVAVGAFEGLLEGVHSYMPSEMGLLSESLAAMFAREGFLIRVNPLVYCQSARLNESLMAISAPEVLHSVVAIDVSAQIVSSREALPASGAHKGLLTRVTTIMPIQVALLIGGIFAAIAFVTSIRCEPFSSLVGFLLHKKRRTLRTKDKERRGTEAR